MIAYTTDVTPGGIKRARNALRQKLWADDRFAHCWLCHDSGDCPDGCDHVARPMRLGLYQSEIEQ